MEDDMIKQIQGDSDVGSSRNTGVCSVVVEDREDE